MELNVQNIFRRIPVKTVIGVAMVGVLVGTYGQAAAVNVGQTVQSVIGARAQTVASTVLATVHNGSKIATNAQAGVADTTIVPSISDPAAAPVRVGPLAAGDFLYSITVQSLTPGDDIPAGVANVRWTINSVEKTASLPVAETVVATSITGGFTLLIAGDAANTPENVQVIVG
jgi:hypothetical protein